MRPHVLSAALGALTLLVARAATAQTITIPNQASAGSLVPLERISSGGTTVSKRVTGLQNVQEGISNDDCLSNQRIRVPLVLTAPNFGDTSLSLEAWAGLNVDCTTRDNRGAGGASLQRCWRITSGQITKDASVTVDVRVQDIVKQDTKSASYVAGTSAACGTLDLNKFNVYFMWIRNQEAVASTFVPFDVDMIGPPALSGIGIDQGDTRLNVNWTSIGEGGAVGNVSVRVYYAPAGDASSVDSGSTQTCSTTLVEGGSVADGGAEEEAITEDAGCTSTKNAAVTCTGAGLGDDGLSFSAPFSTTGPGASQLTIEGLTNYTTYAVKVVAIDDFLNVGESAEAVCQNPVELNDFFETYRNAGGEGGGGFCSVDGAGLPAGTAGLFTCGAAGIIALARRALARRRAAKAPR